VIAVTERWDSSALCKWGVVGDDAMTIFDYVAIGVLVVLIVWAVADWIPRGKL
jgi:hypothetical protein